MKCSRAAQDCYNCVYQYKLMYMYMYVVELVMYIKGCQVYDAYMFTKIIIPN